MRTYSVDNILVRTATITDSSFNWTAYTVYMYQDYDAYRGWIKVEHSDNLRGSVDEFSIHGWWCIV